jgi:hypothetical protein
MNRLEPAVMLAALVALGALPACAGASGDATPDEGSATAGSEAPEAEPDDGMQIEGTLGTISEAAIQDGIQRNLPRISRCFSDRYDAVEVLGGHMDMAFRIKMDGNVRWVYLRDSTVGDRETERCILNVLSRIQFRRPHGGEAEFVTPLDLDPPEDVRPPVEWQPSRVAELVSTEGAALLERCGAQGQAFHVTAYVAPGGQALAAGAAVETPDVEEPLDCVAEGVRSWTWPDPGSYPAKVSFDLP